MEEKDFVMVRKLLMLSQSDQDGEALGAIRAARKILEKYNLNWEEFLKKIIQAAKPAPSAGTPELDTIGDILDFVLHHSRGRPHFDFITSLDDSYNDYGSLTEKQEAALMKFYRNLKRRGY